MDWSTISDYWLYFWIGMFFLGLFFLYRERITND